MRLEHETGLEPAMTAWKAIVLPLHYSCLAPTGDFHFSWSFRAWAHHQFAYAAWQSEATKIHSAHVRLWIRLSKSRLLAWMSLCGVIAIVISGWTRRTAVCSSSFAGIYFLDVFVCKSFFALEYIAHVCKPLMGNKNIAAFYSQYVLFRSKVVLALIYALQRPPNSKTP